MNSLGKLMKIEQLIKLDRDGTASLELRQYDRNKDTSFFTIIADESIKLNTVFASKPGFD